MKLSKEEIRKIAAQTLTAGQADCVIGWEKGDHWWQSPPAFAENERDLDSFIWDPFCTANLSKYLLEELKHKKKVALFVKGCDALAINRLLQDKRIERDQVLLFGLPCPGMADEEKIRRELGDAEITAIRREGNQLKIIGGDREVSFEARDFLQEKCLSCRYPTPVVYDQLLGEDEPAPGDIDRFNRVKKLEKEDLDERFRYWMKQFDRCLRCFACRNVCPACNCRECVFDIPEPRWLGKATELSENQLFHLTRAYHVAGRCIDCGECQRACPMGIPLQELNRKPIKDINELYGEYDAGVNPEEPQPLGAYKTDDADVFSE